MTWNLTIAVAAGLVAGRAYHWLTLKVARRGMEKSERVRQNLVVKLDTAALPVIAKAVEAEMARRAKLVNRTGLM